MVRYRTVSIREDVYQRLSRLAIERNKSMSDLIEELLNCHEGDVGGDSIVESLNEVKTMLRDCLDRLGVRQLAENKPVEAGSRQAEARLGSKDEVGGFGFEDNPWVQILRARGGDHGSQDS